MRKNYKITLLSAALAVSVAVLGCVIISPKSSGKTEKGNNANNFENLKASNSSDATINVADLADDGYKLVWYDEFDGSSLDSTKWCTDKPRMSGDNTLLTISDAAWAIAQKEGNLTLNAIYNNWYDPTATSGFASMKYVAPNSVSTEGKMSFQYGYLEIRAKVPYKEACWPSFWLRSHHATDKRENPEFEVELDVFEVFGSKDTLASNLHQQSYNGVSGNSYMTTGSAINSEERHTFTNSANLNNEYHTYGVEWTPEKITIYIDGKKQCEWKLDKYSLLSYGLKPEVSGFDTTMNILFNNHLFTKNSEYKPSSSNIVENYENNLPSVYQIDYVRLYQKNDGVSKLITGR